MLAFIRLLVLGLLLTFAAPLVMANSTPLGDVQSSQNELLQQKIDHNRELTQKDLDAFKARIDAFDKRIDDQNNRVADINSGVDRFAVIAGVLGLLVTVLLVALGFFSYRSAVAEAKKEAESASEKWFDDNEKALQQRFESLEGQAEQMQQTFQDLKEKALKHSEELHDEMDQIKEDAAKAAKKMQKDFETHGQSQTVSPADKAALHRNDEQIQNKPESSYSFDDWNQRAFAAYAEQNYEDAAYFWKKASEVKNAGAEKIAEVLLNRGGTLGQQQKPEEALSCFQQLIDAYQPDPSPALREQVAKAMLNKGVTLGEQQKPEEELACYQQVIDTYQSDPSAALRERVAKAMLNKGVTLGQLQKPEEELAGYQQVIDSYQSDPSPALREQVARAMLNKGFTLVEQQKPVEALACYQQVIDTYQSDPSPALRERVAKAMLNKGITLAQLQKPEEAVACYQQVIDTYQSDPSAALREQVGRAYNGLGFNSLLKAKQNWATQEEAHALLLEAQGYLLQALELCPDCGMTRGNLAYVQWLQGDKTAAENNFKTALAAPQNGDESLYKGTLADIEQHTVPPDADFRALVERLWHEYQEAQNPPPAAQ